MAQDTTIGHIGERAFTTVTVDQLEQQIVACERLIGRIRAAQLTALRELDARQVRHMDGSRTMADWTAARLDVTPDTAKGLMRASKVLADQPDITDQLTDGAVSFDRAVATASLAATGASPEDIAASLGYDLNGVARLVARRRRITRTSERQTFRDRYLHLQPTLDLTRYKGWFELPGYEGTLVEKALTQRADEFPHTDDQLHERAPRGARLADALVSVAHDTLDPTVNTGNDTTDTGTTGTREPLLSIVMDGTLAAATNGEAGAEIATGTRIGPTTLQRILCDGRIQLIWADGARPTHTTAATRAIPPAIRRYVLHRDGGCVIAGCTSRYRLQVHHIQPRSRGGTHDPTNLATLCWYHHHVAIHGNGYTIDLHSPPQRRRLTPPSPHNPHPP